MEFKHRCSTVAIIGFSSDSAQTGVFQSEHSFVEQIVIYGFGSSAPKSIQISSNGRNIS